MDTKILCSCLICKEVKISRGLDTHQRMMHSDQATMDKMNFRKYRKFNPETYVSSIRASERRADYLKSPCLCKKCGIPMPFNHRLNIFCSHTCSATFEDHQRRKKYSNETKQRISEGITKTSRALRMSKGNFKLTDFEFAKAISGPYTKIYLSTCKVSGKKWYSTTVKTIHPDTAKTFIDYGYHARFSFGIRSYPLWFKDASDLITRHGWYSTPGSKRSGIKNTNGVSRDHMLSVSDGYKQGINPLLLSHPANCKLMCHTENQKKMKTSSITLQELLIKIEDFNKLYPENSFQFPQQATTVLPRA